MSENKQSEIERAFNQKGQNKGKGQNKKQEILVQPGDAYFHMLRASELEKKQSKQILKKQQIIDSNKILEGKAALDHLKHFYQPQPHLNQHNPSKQLRMGQKQYEMVMPSNNKQLNNWYNPCGRGNQYPGQHPIYPNQGFFHHDRRNFHKQFQPFNQFGGHHQGFNYPFPPPPFPNPQFCGNMPPMNQSFIPQPPLGPPPMWNQGFSSHQHRHHGRGHGHRQFHHGYNSKLQGNDGSVNGSNIECRKKWKHKYEDDQENEGKKCWRKGKRSHSHSSSSSDVSSEQELNEKKKAYLMQIQTHYKSLLNGFFESRSINQLQRQKIIKFLRDKFPKYDAPVEQILKSLQVLQAQNLLVRMPYIKVIKVLVKYKFNLTYATPKIVRIQEKKIKKYESDLKFQSKYGNVQVPPLLDHDNLINFDQSKVLYLIDGNNILPTQKDFRKYFQSNSENERVQAKLRCQWLISYALDIQGCYLFFDGCRNNADIEDVSAYLYQNEGERQKAEGVQVIYSGEMSADDIIIEKLRSLVDKKESRQIVLVSSDRDLYMRCIDICKVNHTGGRYFFKFLKYRASKQNKQEKQIKKKIKAIMKYKY